MINLTRPKYVMPVHGDFKRMLIHGELAEAVGVPKENIFRSENGTPLEITAEGAKFGKPEHSGMIFVDGVDIGDVSDVALRDRRTLSADGIFIIVGDDLRGGRLVRRPAGGDRPRRSVPRGQRPVHGGPARSGGGLAGRGRRSADHRGRRPAGHTCTTTSRSSSTTGSSAVRWSCRSWSRSEPCRTAAGRSSSGHGCQQQDPRAREREGGARGARARSAGRRAGSRCPASPRRSTPAGRTCGVWYSRRRRPPAAAVIAATHWMPLPAPPTTDIAHATQQHARLGHAQVGERRRARWRR